MNQIITNENICHINNNIWTALENAIGIEEADNYMFMGIKVQDNIYIYLYKHVDTRCYLNLDSDGKYYKYTRREDVKYEQQKNL